MAIARSTSLTAPLSSPQISLKRLIFERGLYRNVIKNVAKSLARILTKEKDGARAEPCTSFYVYTEMENEC